MLPAPEHTAELAIPNHVAIIMDGNGRWAKKRFLPRAAGHRQGAEAVRKTVRGAVDLGIRYLTLYAFSSENWNRSPEEVDDLMGLLRLYIRQEITELDKSGVRLRFIGDLSRLATDINALINEAEAKTVENTTLTLTIAVSYGGQAEIVAAMKDVARRVAKGALQPEQITDEVIAGALYTRDLPDPDLVIRTSGEQRLSNFLLWQTAYSELVFTDTLWPEFNFESLKAAVLEYGARERRFGLRS